jgi:hypothetical protein
MVLPRYPSAAENLWRWVEAPEQDDAISTFLKGVLPIGRRPRFTERDHTTLTVYAQRCALAAVRSRNGQPVVRAFEALALVKPAKVDEDRLRAAAALVAHASTHLNDYQRIAWSTYVLMMDPDIAEVVASEVDLQDDAGYREMDTPAGRVFLEDEGAVFEPSADLVAEAYGVAAMLEADGYEGESVGIGQTLHPAWLKKANAKGAAATGRLTGCVHVHAIRGLHDVGVYLAEASTDADAEAIGSAADQVDSPKHPQIGVFAGRQFAFLYAGTLDPSIPMCENKSTLDRFRARLRDILTA